LNSSRNPAGPAADNDKIGFSQFSRSPFFKTFLGFNPTPGRRKGLADLGIGDAVYRHAALLAQPDTAIEPSGLFELIGITQRSATGCQQRCSNGLTLVGNDLFTIHLYFKRLASFDSPINSSLAFGHMHVFLNSAA
jgi:hypothetical protein